MCYISTTEFKKKTGYYMELSKKENVYVTKYGKVITVLINPDKASMILINELSGCLKTEDKNIDLDEIIKEEIYKRHMPK